LFREAKGGETVRTEWKKEKCGSLPEEFQRIADDVYMQRRNIHMVERTEENPECGYECECRRISGDVYEALQEELNSPAYIATTKLLEEQSNILAATQLEVEYGVCLQELNME
jgi:hypothetical protein